MVGKFDEGLILLSPFVTEKEQRNKLQRYLESGWTLFDGDLSDFYFFHKEMTKINKRDNKSRTLFVCGPKYQVYYLYKRDVNSAKLFYNLYFKEWNKGTFYFRVTHDGSVFSESKSARNVARMIVENVGTENPQPKGRE